MIARIFLSLLAFMPIAASVDAGVAENLNKMWARKPEAPSPTVKVLVAHDQESLLVQVDGKYRVIDPHANDHISTRFTGKIQIITPMKDGLKWGEEFPGIHQITLVPDSPATKIYVNSTEYKGRMHLYDIGGTISAVNELPLEEYISSMLADTYNQPL